MTWLVGNIKWIMLVSGLLTCSMIYAAIAPHAALRSTFGESLAGPVAEIVVRNWGALIALVGGMLIYGAFEPRVRSMTLVVASLSKLTFTGLVLLYGRLYFAHQAAVAVVVDTVMVLLFVVYLTAVRRGRG